MRDENLRIFLEAGGHRNGRNILRDRIERLQLSGAHEEVEPTDRQQDAVVYVRPSGHDRDVETVLPVRAVGDRLVETAMLGLGDPVGAEADLVERVRRRRGRNAGDNSGNPDESHGPPSIHTLAIAPGRHCSKLRRLPLNWIRFGWGDRWTRTSKPTARTSDSTIWWR